MDKTALKVRKINLTNFETITVSSIRFTGLIHVKRNYLVYCTIKPGDIKLYITLVIKFYNHVVLFVDL